MKMIRINKHNYTKWIPLVIDYAKEIDSFDEFNDPKEKSIDLYLASNVIDPKCVFVGLEDNDKPIAFGVAVAADIFPWNRKRRAWCNALYVIPEYRNKKIVYAKTITDSLVKYFKQNGFDMIEGFVSNKKKNIKRFWTKLGCKEIGTIYNIELKEK